MNPISTLPAQSQVPSAPVAQPKVVAPPSGHSAGASSVERKAPEVKVDAAAEAAAAAAKAKAEINVQQYAQASKEVMQEAAKQIQGYLKESGRNMNVSVDESTGYYVAKVVNPETGEVVRSKTVSSLRSLTSRRSRRTYQQLTLAS